MKPKSFMIPSPDLRIDFSIALVQIRRECLQEALCKAIKDMDIAGLDKELADFVPKKDMAILANRGLRGELLFPVPCLLTRNPKLIAYYRLLYGFRQKAFYGAEFGLAIFKPMEDRGLISKSNGESIPSLCHALSECASSLLKGVGEERLTKEFMDDLSLLTLGPQLRGGASVRKGAAGIVRIFESITGSAKRKKVTRKRDRQVSSNVGPSSMSIRSIWTWRIGDHPPPIVSTEYPKSHPALGKNSKTSEVESSP
jgi:hypothetical protein